MRLEYLEKKKKNANKDGRTVSSQGEDDESENGLHYTHRNHPGDRHGKRLTLRETQKLLWVLGRKLGNLRLCLKTDQCATLLDFLNNRK